MKITDIVFDTSLGFSIEDVNGLLYNDIKNDYIFEKSYITISIEDANPIDILYRKYWEDVYLQNDDKHKSYVDKSKFIMILSLNEVMMYIDRTLPPRLHHMINEIKSIDDIIDMLKEFLVVESNMSITYHSFFRDTLHFQKYETNNDMQNLSKNKYHIKEQFIRKCKNDNKYSPIIIFKYSHDNNIVSKVIQSQTIENTIENNGINIFNCFINIKTDKVFISQIILLIQEMKGSISQITYDDTNDILILDIVNNTELNTNASNYISNSYKRLLIGG